MHLLLVRSVQKTTSTTVKLRRLRPRRRESSRDGKRRNPSVNITIPFSHSSRSRRTRSHSHRRRFPHYLRLLQIPKILQSTGTASFHLAFAFLWATGTQSPVRENSLSQNQMRGKGHRRRLRGKEPESSRCGERPQRGHMHAGCIALLVGLSSSFPPDLRLVLASVRHITYRLASLD
jgi:hypothetical protein